MSRNTLPTAVPTLQMLVRFTVFPFNVSWFEVFINTNERVSFSEYKSDFLFISVSENVEMCKVFKRLCGTDMSGLFIIQKKKTKKKKKKALQEKKKGLA
jgi:hypothetical protein